MLSFFYDGGQSIFYFVSEFHLFPPHTPAMWCKNPLYKYTTVHL